VKAVILAGGLGVRLRPFTEIIPKPLLPLGEKALLEIQLEHLKKYGFDEIFLAINYKSEYIKAFLGDGSKYGVQIIYSVEEKPLGTCGPLSLLQEELTEPFLVMNGDILTKADLERIFRFAATGDDTDLTIVTKIILTPFRFGNVITNGDYLEEIEEKPDIKFEVLAGIYVLKPGIFAHIPSDTYFGMDTLIKTMLAKKKRILRYLMSEYWLDIGQVDDYNQALDLYNTHFV
jgi:NDP-mannose synthase